MSDIETLANMIVELYKTYRSRIESNNNFHHATVYRAHYPKCLLQNEVLKVLKKIEKYKDLSIINIENLNIACIINHYYDDFYKILEYLYIPEVLKEENKFEYYLIRLSLLNVIGESFHYTDSIDKNIDIIKYFQDELKMKKFLVKYEDNIPMNLKARYGIEAANMTKLLIIMYYDYDNSLSNLNDILLKFLLEYQDEIKLNGIVSWFLGKENRKEYVDFLEHYLNNSLNTKKMIK